MVPRSIIHKQKREFFALVSVLLCPLPPTPTFLRTMLKCSRSSARRCNDGMRRNSSPSFSYKRQQKPAVQSVQLRRLGGKQRPELNKEVATEDEEGRWPSKKARGKYRGGAAVKMGGSIPCKKCVCAGQDCLVHPSR